MDRGEAGDMIVFDFSKGFPQAPTQEAPKKPRSKT